jgi:hypothetical protein
MMKRIGWRPGVVFVIDDRPKPPHLRRRQRELLFFCNLNHLPHRNNLQFNKAIPLQGTIPTPGAALQGCLCKYPLTWAQAQRRQPEQRARRQELPQFLPSLIST